LTEKKAVIEFLHMFEQTGNRTSAVFIEGLVTVATINSIEEIDPALLRPGRFDEVIYCKEPPRAQRREIIQHYLNVFSLEFPGTDCEEEREITLDTLTDDMTGFAGADIKEVLQCVSALGWRYCDDEITRLIGQRAHYNEEAFARYRGRLTESSAVAFERLKARGAVTEEMLQSIMKGEGITEDEAKAAIVRAFSKLETPSLRKKRRTGAKGQPRLPV